MKSKAFINIFRGLPFKQIKKTFLENEGPILIKETI